MHQARKNMKSTKQQEQHTNEEQPIEPLTQCTNVVFTKILDPKRQIATDLTGNPPITSNRANKYIFLLYDYVSNNILVIPMKARIDKDSIR